MKFTALCVLSFSVLASVANEAEVAPGGEVSTSSDDFFVLLRNLDDEIIATRKTLKAAQDHVESLSRLREAALASQRLQAGHVASKRQLSVPVQLGQDSHSSTWPRTSFGQFFHPIADSKGTVCVADSQLVGLHFFPIQRSVGWKSVEQGGSRHGLGQGSDTSELGEDEVQRMPRPLLVHVYADGCVAFSSGSHSALLSGAASLLASLPIAETPQSSSTILAVNLTASIAADTPALAVVTSDGILHLWNVTADVYGQRAVGTRAYGYVDPDAVVTTGRGRVARQQKGRATQEQEETPARQGDVSSSATQPPLSVQLHYACSFDMSSAAETAGDVITALHMAATAHGQDTGVRVLVGTRLGKVLAVNHMCTGLKVMYPLSPAGGRTSSRVQPGPGHNSTASTVRPAVASIHSPSLPYPAYFYFSAGSTVHSLPFDRPEYGPVSCAGQWPGRYAMEDLEYLHGRTPELVAASEMLHVQSLASDVNNPNVVWASTRAGDVLVLSARHGGHNSCRLIAQYKGVSALLLELAGLNTSTVQGDRSLALASIRGYTLAVSHAGIVAYNASRLPHEEPRPLVVQARAMEGAEAYTALVQAVASQALAAVVAKTAKRAPGRGSHGKMNSQHSVALIGGRSFSVTQRAQATPNVSTGAIVTLYDCSLPSRLVDPLDDLMSRSGGQGALGWLRGPMFVLAIIIAVMVGRSRAQPPTEDGSQGGIWGMLSMLYSFLIGTDVESTGKTLLGRRSVASNRNSYGQEQEYERMVQRLFAERRDPGAAAAFGAGLGPASRGADFLDASRGGLMFGPMSQGGSRNMQGGSFSGEYEGQEDEELDDNMQRETENLLRVLKGVGRESGGFNLNEGAQVRAQRGSGHTYASNAAQNPNSAAAKRRMEHISMYGEDSSDEERSMPFAARSGGQPSHSHTRMQASAHESTPTASTAAAAGDGQMHHEDGAIYEEPPPSSGSEGEEMARAEAFANPKQLGAENGLSPAGRGAALPGPDDEREDGEYDGLE